MLAAGVALIIVASYALALWWLLRHEELFLVKVLGMSWAEVHDEAEQLEHAVSERLIDRIDEMLGRPEVDPHGDPIPSPEGRIPRIEDFDLLTAPVQTSLQVSRVIDQDPVFLRFVEQQELVPGRNVTIESRDEASDAVRLTLDTGRLITIGSRAAAKVLVRTPSKSSRK